MITCFTIHTCQLHYFLYNFFTKNRWRFWLKIFCFKLLSNRSQPGKKLCQTERSSDQLEVWVHKKLWNFSNLQKLAPSLVISMRPLYFDKTITPRICQTNTRRTNFKSTIANKKILLVNRRFRNTVGAA